MVFIIFFCFKIKLLLVLVKKTMKRTILLILSIFIINLGYSQLSGEYTIDPDQPYAGTNFQSFDDAIMV